MIATPSLRVFFSLLCSSTDSYNRYLPNTLCQALCLNDTDTMVKKPNLFHAFVEFILKVVWYIETMCSLSITAHSQRIRTHSLVEYVY